jgi:hypothetical protein
MVRVRRVLGAFGWLPMAEGVGELVDGKDALLILCRDLLFGHPAQ